MAKANLKTILDFFYNRLFFFKKITNYELLENDFVLNILEEIYNLRSKSLRN